MPSITAIFLLLALTLAALIGPMTEPWLWGPSLLALALASVSALAHLWRQRNTPPSDLGITLLGTITAAWFAWRAWDSPVQDMAHSDLMLLSGAVCAFISLRTIIGHRSAERIVGYGIALLLLASLIVIGMQLADRSVSVWFSRAEQAQPISGFFTHYNYGANFLIACSMTCLSIAIFSKEPLIARITLGIMATAAFAAILLSNSRGGLLSMIVAASVLIIALVINGYHNKAKWFPLAAIALPIIGLLLAGALFMGWQSIQETRSGSEDLDTLMDNQSRLMLLGAAASCITMHPWAGGGSRSFLWEFVQVGGDIGQNKRNGIPEFVHNEWMQALTDYGLIGGILLFTLISWILIRAFTRLLFKHPAGDEAFGNTWRIAGLAASVGILLQACFSFVFHIMPSALLLGICLAMASVSPVRNHSTSNGIQRGILSLVILAALACIIPLGWKATRVTTTIAASHYAKGSLKVPVDQKIAQLNQAVAIWPHTQLFSWRATHHQMFAAHTQGETQLEHFRKAALDYRAAIKRNPYDGESLINLANSLGQLQQDDEATKTYLELLTFQGKMERLYRGNYFYARHLYKIAIQQSSTDQFEAALKTCELATHHIDEAESLSHAYHIGPEGRSLQIACHELLGMLLEAASRDDEALASYTHAASLHRGSGRRIHLRAAILLAKQAQKIWFEREPGKALGLFIQARQQTRHARDQLPEGMTEGQRNALVQKIENAIKILQQAKIQPE